MRYSTFKKHSDLIEARLTSINTQVTTAAAAPSLSEQQKHILNLHLSASTKKYQEFEKHLNKLYGTESAEDDIDTAEVSKIYDTISNLYISIHSSIAVLLPPSTPVDASADPNTSVQSNNANANGRPSLPNVNLPRLNLPKFAGQPDKWIAFHSLFENTIYKNESLSNVEKFSYLLSCLTDEALNLVKSLPVTSPNFIIAWQTLTKRYHNSRLLITLHVNNILDLPQMNNPNVKQLRSFISAYNENVQALLALNHDATTESLILCQHLLRKFGPEFRSKFEHSRKDSKNIPTIQEFIEFMDTECTQLEAASIVGISQASVFEKANTYGKPSVPHSKTNYKNPNKIAMITDSQASCAYCTSTSHAIYRCDQFAAINAQARYTFIKSKHLCVNCFGTHKLNDCRSTRNCKHCNKRHHTMLHLTAKPATEKHNSDSSSYRSANSSNSIPQPHTSEKPTIVAFCSEPNNTILLATALVHVTTDEGNSFVARAVLDSAAQATFVSEHCARNLMLRRSHTSSPNINGIASSLVKTKGTSHITISSLSGTVLSTSHPVIILDKITNDLPKQQISPHVKDMLKHLVLADPTFDTPAPIDLLIGADLFPLCLRNATHSLGENMPTALNTIFGYVIIGNAQTANMKIPYNGLVTLLTSNDLDIHASIQKFWATEEPPLSIKTSPAEQQCEEHFLTTHSRTESGRYVCRLPFKSDPSTLGCSSNKAQKMMYAIENKFLKEPEFKAQYVKFMTDYRESGHMRKCETPPPTNQPHYFLPHHGVFKDGKIRVVFNASVPTSSNVSLNSILHQGSKLHNEITDIILKFRMHKFVFTCDIKQMFRQISIHEDDQRFQLIYWREDTSRPIQLYKLTTVTYGITSSPYLANRVVQQLIDDEGHNHPMAAQALRRQIFVDDALLGSNSEEDALRLKEDITQLLRKGGFELRKWASNSSKLMDLIPADHRDTPIRFRTPEQPCFNVLGLKWMAKEDVFSYIIEVPEGEITKRSVLSAIARIYDPSGWLSPVVLWAKALMQHLWTIDLQWDDPLPNNISEKWSKFAQELPLLENLKIPRYLGIDSAINNLQLHGFSDASEAAYAASVYIRIEKNDDVEVNLLIAKSRVAPLKRVTLPRLELCGAHLLAKLLNYCVTQLLQNYQINEIFAWCDSSVALSWIHTPSYRLKTYVANRVAEIQELTPSNSWQHVNSADNPADCASRGVFSSALINHPLWWSGPTWLKYEPIRWPKNTVVTRVDVPDLKPQTVDNLISTNTKKSDIFHRFSSWKTVQHVMAYVLRFIKSLKTKSKIVGHLNSLELERSTHVICYLIQQDRFSQEIALIKKGKVCSTPVQRLAPFIDQDNVLRVGGRLRNAPLPADSKNPILLPKRHHVVNLIIDYFHQHYLHAGPQHLQALITEHFWILSARSIIRSRIFKCIRCFKMKPKLNSPFMGDLPPARVTPTRPFSTSGVDYAGPFSVKLYTLRRLQPIKVYLALFICFSTKAVHLEVVTDLTSEAFIAALTRFISRRGQVKHLHSDCGTNFIGAASALKRCFEDLARQPMTRHFAEENNISFHFLPPNAPHQGGLWERAVKSAKHHLQRVIGTQILTYEEFITLVSRTEAMLNSRPLTPLSSDPNDLEPLTPGHFLTGGPLTSIIEPQHEDICRLKRWHLVQAFSQHIWKRWYQEYLSTLQQRSKWTSHQENLKIDDLVVIHDLNTPPLRWKLGRITKVSPGADGVVRVVHIRTATGNFSRPAVKVSRLPIS